MILAGNQSKQRVPLQRVFIEKQRWRSATNLCANFELACSVGVFFGRHADVFVHQSDFLKLRQKRGGNGASQHPPQPTGVAIPTLSNLPLS